MKMMATVLAAGIASAACASNVRITEWMYSGNLGEFVEFTNIGNVPVDMTGWSYDDDSRLPGVFDLSGAGTLMPGESFIITEVSPAAFIADWGLSGVTVLGPYTNNLGRNDEINLYDSGGNLVDRFTYGDQAFPGTIRTQTISGNPNSNAALGANDVYQWSLSFIGDVQGSWFSAGGDLGNPGTYIPAPASIALLGLGLASAARRRR
ncbi:MAG: PEP-CTERM sorting domain-containing protein [Leptolyngbya sp. PLA2]|nr:PEP-CTERM sorting domain-containing protein [Leptolyngbya sp. PL-A2]MCQ3940416.1 PEP-CTERM sorting domain-containing protein [cyanobacterium CYA1]MDL1904266.1 PEP-CTERM sorting domain-containing protein [Synechococcales cyanobacterium CNB]